MHRETTCISSTPSKHKGCIPPFSKRPTAQKIGLILAWTISLLWMMVIFILSAQPALQSQELSDGFLDVLIATLHLPLTSFMVRKAAHATEYLLLGIFLYAAVSVTAQRKQFFIPFIMTALYAVTDEIHQMFVPGRACQVRDMLIDACGALVGVLLCEGVVYLRKKSKKRREHEHGSN